MKNIVIILTFFFLGSWMLLFVFFLEAQRDALLQTTQSGTHLDSASWELLDTQSEDISVEEPDAVRSKIETIKKRLALKGLIIEGDSYYQNQQLPLALKKYLEFYKKNPSDPLILEKIASTYFEMKKFGSSVNYLEKMGNIPTSQKDLYAKSLIYSADLSASGTLLENLETYQYPAQDMFYYRTSVSCMQDFSQCKSQFQSYFTQFQATQSGAQLSQELQTIQQAFENYKNFQLDDIALKNAYLIGAWYQNELYPVAIELGKQILQEKPGYKPVLKIIAQSYFELGQYEKARDTLWDFYELDGSDPSIAYMLWVVNEKLKEYVLANIYLSKSLELGYTPSIKVRRQMIHNFYLLENDASMLASFADMVEKEESLEADDLGLAIYYHILHEKYDEAQAWSKKWQWLFPTDGDFYAYEGWILREQGDLTQAAHVLQKALSLDATNPFLFINLAYTALAGWNTGSAKVYFQKTISAASESEFAQQAKIELQSLAPHTP